MVQQPRLSTAERIRRAAQRAIDAADLMDTPSETTRRVDQLIGHIEDAANEMRAAVRGAGRR